MSQNLQQEKNLKKKKCKKRPEPATRGVTNALTGNVRIVVFGGAGVGKSCLILRFLYDRFREAHVHTVEDLLWGQRGAHGVRWNLEVLDTAGSFSFPAMRRLAMDTGGVFLLVYGVDDEESFEEVRRLREELLARRAEKKTPVVVVGNKCDVLETRRFLPAHTTDFIVNIEWGHYYVETSAKDGTNVDKAFTEVLRELASDKKEKPPPPLAPFELVEHTRVGTGVSCFGRHRPTPF